IYLAVGLGAAGDLQRLLAAHRRDLDLRAERRLRERDRHLADEVVLLTLEEGVRLYVDKAVQVAARPAVPARLALARYPELRPVLDAGRDPDRDLALHRHAAGAPARPARLLDDRPFAAAARAGLTDREEALRHLDLAGAAAVRAGDAAGGALGARPVALLARLLAAQLD